MSAVLAPARPWTETSLLDLAGRTATARFLSVVESIPPRTRFTVNDIRHRLDAADVPERLRGGLMHAAKMAGLIESVTVSAWGQDYEVRVRSTGETAHRATVRVYRRLGDPAPGDAASGGAL
ncbi:hypothetical protein [Cellulomonas olei]|uniref:hypothetical protein n=1 Tax=Cellulomonas sp. P4 TaxID=3142533 RepID=UPI0031BACB04